MRILEIALFLVPNFAETVLKLIGKESCSLEMFSMRIPLSCVPNSSTVGIYKDVFSSFGASLLR